MGSIEFIKEVRRPPSMGGAQEQAFQEEGTEDAKALRWERVLSLPEGPLWLAKENEGQQVGDEVGEVGEARICKETFIGPERAFGVFPL